MRHCAPLINQSTVCLSLRWVSCLLNSPTLTYTIGYIHSYKSPRSPPAVRSLEHTHCLSEIHCIMTYSLRASEVKTYVAPLTPMSRGQISHLHPTPKTLNQYVCRFKFITMSAQEVHVQNLVWIESAVTDLRMREKTCFRVDFNNLHIAPLLFRATVFFADFNV